MTELTPAQQKAVDYANKALATFEKAEAALSDYDKLVKARDEAQVDLEWAENHPLLAGIEWRAAKADDQPAEEKPKRTRRTKAQIEADRAAEEAAKAQQSAPAYPAPTQENGATVARLPEGVTMVQNNTGQPEPVQAPPAQQAPPPAPSNDDADYDPFAQ